MNADERRFLQLTADSGRSSHVSVDDLPAALDKLLAGRSDLSSAETRAVLAALDEDRPGSLAPYAPRVRNMAILSAVDACSAFDATLTAAYRAKYQAADAAAAATQREAEAKRALDYANGSQPGNASACATWQAADAAKQAALLQLELATAKLALVLSERN